MTNQVGAGEVRMLIAGELVEAASGKRFDNINPATEEVLGEVADAEAADMQRAIGSARRAFDESDWSTNRALRKRSLEQLQAALESERGGVPRGADRGGRDAPHDDLRRSTGLAPRRGALVAGQDDRPVRLGAGPARREHDGHAQPPLRLEGGHRGHRRHRAVELPARGDAQQARTDPRHRQHGGPQAGPRHALECHASGPPDRREDRHPTRRRQRGHLLRPPGRGRSSPSPLWST